MNFAVLFVCTSNTGMSVIAERLLVARLGVEAGAEVSVGSRGTQAETGCPVDPFAGLVLREFGGSPNGHMARQLGQHTVRRASLVLTSTSSQRESIVHADRSALRRVFTLREFARLGRDLPPRRPGPPGVRLTARVRQMAEYRVGAPPPGSSVDEIVDPLGASLDVVRFRGEQISAAVDGVLWALGLQTTGGRVVRHRALTLE